MTDRCDDKIRAFVVELVDDPPPAPDIDFETVQQPAFDSLDRSRPSIAPRRGWAVAVVAASAVLVLLGVPVALAWVLNRSIDVTQTAPPIATSMPEPTTPTTQPPTPAASPVTWARIEDADLGSGDETTLSPDGIPQRPAEEFILSVASTDHEWMVGGHSERDAAVWISTDASDWVPTTDDQGAFGDAASPYEGDGWRDITGLARLGGRTVAVGFEDLNRDWAGAAEQRIAAVWYTDDGEIWHRIEHDPDIFGVFAYNEMRAVTATPSGFVAVGTDVWTSADGIRWDRHQLHPGTASAIIATERGLIAAGTTGNSDQWRFTHGVSAVWTSVDGVTWNPSVVETTPTSERSWIEAMAATATGFVAVGTADTGTGGLDSAAWISADGATWDLSWTGNVIDADSILSGVAADGLRVVAVGTESLGGATPNYGGTVWWSEDAGASWLRDPDPQFIFGHPRSQDRGGMLTAIVKAGDRFLTVGTLAEEPAIWIGSWKD